jgi:hypothetical protein
VSQRSNGYFAPTVVCNAFNARQRAQRSKARAGGTPDSLQCLSGAPPDSQAGPHVRAPTVGTQRPGDVAGAPDSVQWRTGLSGAPVDSSLHQTPHSSHPRFPPSNYLQELGIQYKTHPSDQILSKFHKSFSVK